MVSYHPQTMTLLLILCQFVFFLFLFLLWLMWLRHIKLCWIAAFIKHVLPRFFIPLLVDSKGSSMISSTLNFLISFNDKEYFDNIEWYCWCLSSFIGFFEKTWHIWQSKTASLGARLNNLLLSLSIEIRIIVSLVFWIDYIYKNKYTYF